MIKTNINKHLFIKDYSIRELDEIHALAASEKDPQNRLQLLNNAINEIEKFHSFFHFEQSYFHLRLGILYLKNKQRQEASEEFANAIFQDHLNHQAIFLQKQNHYLRSDPVYRRPVSDFKSYLIFANTNQEALDNQTLFMQLDRDNYWHYCDNHVLLEKVIEQIRCNHLNYHTASAKFYLNRAATFASLGQKDLAKNDLIKAGCLDANVTHSSALLHDDKLLL